MAKKTNRGNKQSQKETSTAAKIISGHEKKIPETEKQENGVYNPDVDETDKLSTGIDSAVKKPSEEKNDKGGIDKEKITNENIKEVTQDSNIEVDSINNDDTESGVNKDIDTIANNPTDDVINSNSSSSDKDTSVDNITENDTEKNSNIDNEENNSVIQLDSAENGEGNNGKIGITSSLEEENELAPSPEKIILNETSEVTSASDDDNDDGVEITGSKEGDRVKKKNMFSDDKCVEYGEWTVESRLTSFINWAKSKGVTLSQNVKITNEGTSHRYGLMATDEVKKGETLVSIPREVMLHPDNSRIVAELVDYEDWLDSIGQSLDDSSGWATLLISLMVEFNDHDSYWAPYLRLVPQSEDFGHAIFWNNEVINEELKGTTLLYDVQRDIYNIEAEYKQYILPFIYRYKDICGRVDRYNVNIYKRLVAFVMAYSFTEGSDTQPAMIPMADIMNHSVNNNANLVFEEDTVKIVACKNIKKDEEVFQSFGKLGNAELLQMYGYAELKPNMFDCLPILVTTFLDVMESMSGSSDVYFQAKVALLNKTEVAISDDYFLFDRNGLRKGPDILQMLKILCMPQLQFENLLKMRSSNRPDSFYKKLLRKLDLAKKTDASSGVAVIDITEDEDQEMDKDNDADKEDNDLEPPTKRQMVEGEDITTVGSINGNSISNAIVIDESDDDGDDDSEKDEKDIGEGNAKILNIVKDSGLTSVMDDSVSEMVNEKSDLNKQSTPETENTSSNEEESNGNGGADKSEKVDKDVGKLKENDTSPIDKDNSTVQIDSSLSVDDTSLNDVANVKENEKDHNDEESDIDDVEFVSEDIRCKMTYDRLSKEMNLDWKTFVKNVIDCYVKTLKEDKDIELEEAKVSMSHRQLCAYLVRQGQRNIADKFLAVLET